MRECERMSQNAAWVWSASVSRGPMPLLHVVCLVWCPTSADDAKAMVRKRKKETNKQWGKANKQVMKQKQINNEGNKHKNRQTSKQAGKVIFI